MSFAPPPGPPPPSVPEGWKAQYEPRYERWFFVNLRTGKSQWEPPEVTSSEEEKLHGAPSEPPPSYEDSAHSGSSAPAKVDEKKSLGSNNPYNHASFGESTLDSDARLAARLQAEEEAQARVKSPGNQGPGAAMDYYAEASRPQSSNHRASPGTTPLQNIDPEQKSRSKGFLSKLMGKSSSGGGNGFGRPPSAPYHQQPQQQPVYGYPQGGYPGGYPPQPVGYGYPAYPPQGGYYPPAMQQQRRRPGMGTAGAAALGVGGGLLGGALLANAFDDHHDYDDYGGGDDFGGGDF